MKMFHKKKKLCSVQRPRSAKERSNFQLLATLYTYHNVLVLYVNIIIAVFNIIGSAYIELIVVKCVRYQSHVSTENDHC